MVRDKIILLVEDNSDDEILTLRTLEKNNIDNEVIGAHDGAEALDYLFGKGIYSGRDTRILPQVVLLDLTLPQGRWLQRVTKDPYERSNKRLPVVILTASGEEQVTICGDAVGATVASESQLNSRTSSRPSGIWECTGCSSVTPRPFSASLNGLARSRPDR